MRTIVLSLLFLSALAFAGDPAPKKSSLCAECAGKMYTADVGTCEACGGYTESGAFHLCAKCAIAKGVCQHCGKPLGGPEGLILESDGWKLAATFTPHVGAESKGGAVLLHQMNRTRADWAALTAVLVKEGVDVLSFDLRGHGESTLADGSKKAWKDFSNEEFLGMVADATNAVKALRARPGLAGKPVVIMGASIGANAALRCASADESIAGVVLLSPGLDYKGVTTEDAMGPYGARPILLVASKDDAKSNEAVEKLASLAKGAKQLVVYSKAGHGTGMFGQEDSPGALTESIRGWVAALVAK